MCHREECIGKLESQQNAGQSFPSPIGVQTSTTHNIRKCPSLITSIKQTNNS